MSSNYPWPTARLRAKRLDVASGSLEAADRQDRVAGFDTARFQQQRVLCVGAGGLGGPIAIGLVKKGIGRIDIVDDDVVELSNLSRQFFTADDLFRPKALCLAQHAAVAGVFGSVCVGHQVAFDAANADCFAGVDCIVVGVDNNRTRGIAATFGRRCGIPVVFTALDESASYVWAFIQKPTGPCLGCVFPRVTESAGGTQPCRAVPAILDPLYIAAGFVLRAVDHVVLGRELDWNFRSLHLFGGAPDVVETVQPRPNCRLCRESVEGRSNVA